MTLLTTLIGTLLFAVAGPVVGCLLAGLDRIISARMQGRVGPPLLQPYYDVRKLFEKERVSVNSVEGVYVACALLFALIAGGIFYSGGNLLAVRVRHHAVEPVLHHGRLFHAQPLRRDRRGPRDAAGDELRAHGAAHGRGHCSPGLRRLPSTWPRCSSSTTRSSAPSGSCSWACSSSSPSSCASRPSTCPCRITPTRRSCAA